jgi:tetratricopeptide (TPR) repeat protein
LKGDWPVAFDEVNRTLEMAERLGLTGGDMTLAGEVWRALILLGMGDLNQAEKFLENSNAKKNPAIHHIVNLNLALGKVRMEQGREDDAKACFETCVNAFRKSEFHPLQPQQIETLLYLTSIYSKQGKLDEARKMSEWARRLAETLKGDACFALASQAEASLTLAVGDIKRAEEAYLRCLDLWERAGWPYYHAKALLAYSEALAQNNHEESAKRLEQAAEIFRKLGAKRDLEKAEAKLSVI